MSNAVAFVKDGEPRTPMPNVDWLPCVNTGLSGGFWSANNTDAARGPQQCYRRIELPPDWKAPEPPAPEPMVLVPSTPPGPSEVRHTARSENGVTTYYNAVPLAELRRVPECESAEITTIGGFNEGYRACLAKLGIHP